MMLDFDNFFKKSAIIDLDKGKISVKSYREFFRSFLGGKGLSQWILFDEIRRGTRPLDPQNVLILSAGPLTGTDTPCSTRHSFDTMNTLTNGVGSSNSCGFLGPELKFAGFNQIILKGRSNFPVLVYITNDEIEILKSEHLSGKGTNDTEEIIRKDFSDKDIQVASIGPAGENLVRYASIMANKTRAAGKCGTGAVMGSKNLKAIAVRGHDNIEIADPDAFQKSCEEAFEKIRNSPYLEKMKKFGPPSTMITKNDLSSLPFKNFQECYIDLGEKSYDSIDPEKYQKYFLRSKGYFNCPVKCNKVYNVSNFYCESLEANSITNFACKLGLKSPKEVMRLHMKCDDLGMDEDSVAGSMAWAIECFERGIINKDLTGGLQLEWGDFETISLLMDKIAKREGIGKLLAYGSKKASELIGKGAEYAMHIKGQDLYEHLRTMKGWALGVVISTRGGGHTSGAPMTEFMNLNPKIAQEKWGVPSAGDPTSYEGKADLVFYYEILHAVVNSLGVCLFISDWSGPDLLDLEDFSKLLTSASGITFTKNNLVTIGERIVNVEKAFNTLHAGFTRKDDYPPGRFFNEKIKSGPLKGEALDKKMWDNMLDQYYDLHDWDKTTSLQKKDKLEKLGLIEVSKKLKKEHLLGEYVPFYDRENI